jgi:hypothetical protein
MAQMRFSERVVLLHFREAISGGFICTLPDHWLRLASAA